MGELTLIQAFRRGAPKHPWLRVGPGSDCAVLTWKPTSEVVYKIDQVIEGTHFLLDGPEAASPRKIGWKAMAKACSDLAAAGSWPVAATVAVNLRKGTPDRVAMELFRGLTDCCKKFKFALAGGDFTTSPQGMSVVVSLLGECPSGKAWTRAGAKIGDVLAVTGPLGASRWRKHLNFTPLLETAKLLRQQEPDGIHACIDITDGLSRDLYHLCQESHCGALLQEAEIPYSLRSSKVARQGGKSTLEQALSDGEDFELLLAISPEACERMLARKKNKAPLHVIGRITAQRHGVKIVRADGKVTHLKDVGYEHLTTPV